MTRIQTLRQVVITIGLALCSISDGFIFGQMSGMVDALCGKDNGISITENDVSWIASTINATCIFGFALAALVTEKFGRRRAITILSMPMLMTWLMIYFANDFVTFVASRVIVGLCYGGVLLLIYITMAEYVKPNNRAIYLNIVAAIGPSLGTMLGHVLCILVHWRTVALIGLIPTGLSAFLPLFWIESPLWLASKGRFDECIDAFRKLHGVSTSSEAELELLIKLEKTKQKDYVPNGKFFRMIYKKIIIALQQRYIWKIILLCIVISIYRVAGGRILYSTLAITMLQEITGSTNILMFTLLVDGFIILGSILPLFLFQVMKMRTLLFTFGLISNISLVVLSMCLYFIPKDNIYYAWVCSLMLSFYFIVAYAGPYAVLEIILAEVYPLELKPYCIFGLGTFAGVATFLSVKWAPRMFDVMGYRGVFLLNSAIVFLCMAYLWFFMPETKGKSLHEIELFFRGGQFVDESSSLKAPQSESLLSPLTSPDLRIVQVVEGTHS